MRNCCCSKSGWMCVFCSAQSSWPSSAELLLSKIWVHVYLLFSTAIVAIQCWIVVVQDLGGCVCSAQHSHCGHPMLSCCCSKSGWMCMFCSAQSLWPPNAVLLLFLTWVDVCVLLSTAIVATQCWFVIVQNLGECVCLAQHSYCGHPMLDCCCPKPGWMCLFVCRVEDSEWRGPGRAGKRNRQQNRNPDQQLWTTSAALLHSDSNVPQRLRMLPRGTNSNISNVNAK